MPDRLRWTLEGDIRWYARVVVHLVGSLVIAGITLGSGIALRRLVSPQLSEGPAALFNYVAETTLVGSAAIFLFNGVLVTLIDVVRTTWNLGDREK